MCKILPFGACYGTHLPQHLTGTVRMTLGKNIDGMIVLHWLNEDAFIVVDGGGCRQRRAEPRDSRGSTLGTMPNFKRCSHYKKLTRV